LGRIKNFMTAPHHKLAKNKKRLDFLIAAVVMIGIVAIGCILLFVSHAEGPYTSALPSGGALTGNAAISTTNTSALNSKSVVFSASSTPVGTTSGCYNGSVPAPCIGSTTTAATGWGTPVFDDEFNGTSLNTSAWSYGYYSDDDESPTGELTGPVNSAEDDCYNPALVSESGGYLRLGIEAVSPGVTCLNSGGATKGYETGMISTLNWNSYAGVTPSKGTGYFTFATGYAEARIWLPTANAAGVNGPTTGTTGTISDWPAWWLPGYGEIDILEGLGGSGCWHVHNSAYTLGPGGCGSGQYGGGWHTYAVDWTNGSATFYYDGQNVGTETSSEEGDSTPLGSTNYKFLILAMQTNEAEYNTSTDPDTAPAAMYVDYARVWE
jgi:hypothetical protein